MTIEKYKNKIIEIEDDVNKLVSALNGIIKDTHTYNNFKNEDYFDEFFKKDAPKLIDINEFDFDEFAKKDFPAKMHFKENLSREFNNAIDHFLSNFRFLAILFNREIETAIDESLKIEDDEPDSSCPFCFEQDIHITKIDNYFDVFFQGEFSEEGDDTFDFTAEHKGLCNLCGGKWIHYYSADDHHILFCDTWD